MDKNEKQTDGLFTKLKARMSKLLTKRNQRIWFVVTIVMAALSILDVVFDLFILPVSIAVYVLAAVSFFSSCALWIQMIRLIIKTVLIPFTESNRLVAIFVKDYRLRTIITALPGLGMTFIYAIFNAIMGIVNRSAWSGSLAAYYILLCVMRFISVMYAKSIYIDKRELSAEQRELKVYKNCGIMLSCMSLALGGAVIMLVNGEGGTSYPGLTVIVMAAYTFYKLIFSIIGMKRARKEKSLLVITMRNIGNCEALVSLLSLQTALFAAYGQDSGDLIPVMNAATGAGVCAVALGLGAFMIINSTIRKKKTGGVSNDKYSGS